MEVNKNKLSRMAKDEKNWYINQNKNYQRVLDKINQEIDKNKVELENVKNPPKEENKEKTEQVKKPLQNGEMDFSKKVSKPDE